LAGAGVERKCGRPGSRSRSRMKIRKRSRMKSKRKRRMSCLASLGTGKSSRLG
jgi:hypothetical protein